MKSVTHKVRCNNGFTAPGFDWLLVLVSFCCVDFCEQLLVNDYLGRIGPLGRKLALGPAILTEIDERKARTGQRQSAALIAAVTPGAFAIALDERGEAVSSTGFARMLEELRDRGTPETVFLNIDLGGGLPVALQNAVSDFISRALRSGRACSERSERRSMRDQ